MVRGKVDGIGGGKQPEDREESGRGGEKKRKGRGEVLELQNVGISEKGRGECSGKGRVRIPRGTRLRRVREPGRRVKVTERLQKPEKSRGEEVGREEG